MVAVLMEKTLPLPNKQQPGWVPQPFWHWKRSISSHARNWTTLHHTCSLQPCH